MKKTSPAFSEMQKKPSRLAVLSALSMLGACFAATSAFAATPASTLGTWLRSSQPFNFECSFRPRGNNYDLKFYLIHLSVNDTRVFVPDTPIMGGGTSFFLTSPELWSPTWYSASQVGKMKIQLSPNEVRFTSSTEMRYGVNFHGGSYYFDLDLRLKDAFGHVDANASTRIAVSGSVLLGSKGHGAVQVPVHCVNIGKLSF